MCILFLYVNPTPQQGKYRLVLASNREEYYQRLSGPIRKWPEDESIVAGLDLEKGGSNRSTWLGLSTRSTERFKFRIGSLLNLAEKEHTIGAPGRGSIVANFLRNEQSCSEYIADLVDSNIAYNALNFVSVQLSNGGAETWYYSNRPTTSVCITGEEYMAFGNSLLDVPLRKVSVGKERFRGIVQRMNNVEKYVQLVDELLDMLKSKDRHLPDPELQCREEVAYEYLSSIFVDIDISHYGTLSHSIILVDFDWNVKFVEVAMNQPYSPQTKNCWSTVVVDSEAWGIYFSVFN